MSDSTHANYAKVGAALVLGVVAAIAAVVYIGGAGAGRKEILAETYCDRDVSGLSVGSDVNFRGVKVGEVKGISFVGVEYDAAEKDRRKVLVTMSFNTKLFKLDDVEEAEDMLSAYIGEGLHATVTASGITGLSHVELDFPVRAVADEPISWNPAHLCIPPAPSLMHSFSDAATRLMNHMDRMDFRSTWSNISSVASSASRIAENFDAIVDSQRSGIDVIVRNIEEATSSLKALADELKSNPSLLFRSNDPAALPETSR